MLNSDHKPIVRGPDAKENERPSRRADQNLNLFSQPTACAPKHELLEKYTQDTTSSATTISTVAQSQVTEI